MGLVESNVSPGCGPRKPRAEDLTPVAHSQGALQRLAAGSSRWVGLLQGLPECPQGWWLVSPEPAIPELPPL